jgi:peptide/nickel transport system ATP-binding protein
VTPAVVCRDLFKVHRTPEGDAAALQGLTLQVASGELVVCLGPSGSGKSTLLRVLAGLEAPSAGTASVLGHDLGRASAGRRAVLRRDLLGLVDQYPGSALPPDLGVAAGVALPLELRGTGRRAAGARARDLLERVGLGSRLDARPAELSGGERQRASVCAALAHRPRLLLADEPTGELDAASAQAVLTLVAGLAREHGAAVLLVTHDPMAAAIGDRTVHVRDGRVSDEDAGGGRTVVIDRGGWLRVPEVLLAGAGIGSRARARREGPRVVLEPAEATGDAPGDARAPVAGRPASAAPPAAPGLPDAPAGGVAVAAEGVAKAFGARVVLSGVDAAFAPGTFSAVTGRSGSGKSTLLRILAGLEAADAGTVRIGPQELGELDREARARLRAREVAVVGQGVGLLGHLSALEQLGGDAGRAEEWLAALHLSERARLPVGRLSAGERQRVAIARGLASGRGVLLLDEPSSRLDEANAAGVGALLAAAAAEHGRTVVCATHDPLLGEHAGRVLALDAAPTSAQ